jgi:hypothetical protein
MARKVVDYDTKRRDFLEAALIMDRLLDSRNFPGVVDALNKKNEGRPDFDKICADLEIPDTIVEPLWKAMLDGNKRVANEPGWIPGM